MNLVTGFILQLVRCARWNPNPFSGGQNDGPAINFHDRFAREYVEELLRMMVKVANLRSVFRHAFLNHAELRIPYQVPAIALVAPRVMLSGSFADRSDFLTIHSSANNE